MLTFVQGEAVTITVPFARDGEPFLADAGSVSWSLRDQNGILMSGYLDQDPVEATDTFAIITVPSLANAVAVDRIFEKRFVVVRGTRDAVPFQAQVAYRLAPWLNHTVTADAVRAFIGTDAGELPDAEIDLVAAYFTLAAGLPSLADALASGTRSEQVANDALKGQAVLDVLPGLRQRMSKREEDGTMKVERFEIDFDKLAADATHLVAAAGVVIGLFDDTLTAPVLFILGSPTTDPVTGDAI